MEIKVQINKITEVGGEKVEAIICFFLDMRGGLVGIMEARKPDRQGRQASLLASSLPRFISYCHAAAMARAVHVCVCVFGCPVCVCSNVGRIREDGGGHVGQSEIHILLECNCCIARSSRAGCCLLHWPGLLTNWTHSNTSHSLLHFSIRPTLFSYRLSINAYV